MLAMTDDEITGRAKGGHARAEKLSQEQRSEIARKAAEARWGDDTVQATHTGEIKIGDAVIFAAVLPDGTRVISQSTLLRALGRHPYPKAGQGGSATLDELPVFLSAEAFKSFVSSELAASTKPLLFLDHTGTKTVGYRASLLPEVAEVYLRYRDQCLADGREIPARYQNMVQAADILIRGLANVGIIALVDEATGFQRDRAADALARILEEFIAKELRPWIKTFPDQFYEELFRLRGLSFPRDSVRRPQYFGHLTNDIVYGRLAPAVLDELRTSTPKTDKGRRQHHFHRKLTDDIGHPKLREHMAAVIAVMQLSPDYDAFIANLDRVRPSFVKVPLLAHTKDDGKGI